MPAKPAVGGKQIEGGRARMHGQEYGAQTEEQLENFGVGVRGRRRRLGSKVLPPRDAAPNSSSFKKCRHTSRRAGLAQKSLFSFGRHVGPPIPGGNADPFRGIKTCSLANNYQNGGVVEDSLRRQTGPRTRRPKRMTHRPGRRSMRRGTNTTAGWDGIGYELAVSSIPTLGVDVDKSLGRGSIAQMGCADRERPSNQHTARSAVWTSRVSSSSPARQAPQ